MYARSTPLCTKLITHQSPLFLKPSSFHTLSWTFVAKKSKRVKSSAKSKKKALNRLDGSHTGVKINEKGERISLISGKVKKLKTHKKKPRVLGLNLQGVEDPVRKHFFDPNSFYDSLIDQAKTLKKSAPTSKKPLIDDPHVKKDMEQAAAAAARENATQDHLSTLPEYLQPFHTFTASGKSEIVGNLVFVTLIRSANHQVESVKKAIQQLGLRRIHQTQVHADTQTLRGLIYHCRHLLHIHITHVRDIFPNGLPIENEEHLKELTQPRESFKKISNRRAENRRAVPKNEQVEQRVLEQYGHLREERLKQQQTFAHLLEKV